MAESTEEYYVLPSHPSKVCLDPLGLSDEENPTVWVVIEASLHAFRSASTPPNIHQMPNLIENLSYSVHLNGHLNTQYLSRFLAEKYPDPQHPAATILLSSILDAALSLPTVFPSHTLRHLSAQHPLCELSVPQIKCLLAHQILNTLTRPKGNNWGCTFSCWYSEPQALESAVYGYLTTLFQYFSQLPLPDTTAVTYQYFTHPVQGTLESQVRDWTGSSRLLDALVIEPVSSDTVHFPHTSVNSVLVASNKSPGFGSSCTQEELVTAACPPLLLLGALLVNPPVPSDAALLAYGLVPVTHWQGQGREARSLGVPTTGHHTFLLLDAAELDASTKRHPDLDLDCLLRDLHKAYVGFMALRQQGVLEVSSPLWGAGSFGGDPFIKTLVLTMASARVGIKLHLSVDNVRKYRRASEGDTRKSQHLLSLLQNLQKRQDLTVGAAMRRLLSLARDTANSDDNMDVVRAFVCEDCKPDLA